MATLTAVFPPSRFGALKIEDEMVKILKNQNMKKKN